MKYSHRGGLARGRLAKMRHVAKGLTWIAFGLFAAPLAASLAMTTATTVAMMLAAPSAHAQPADARRRVERDISVMERALDEMLIDSPNFFVSGRGNTRGLYVDGVGALFTFEATLVNKDWDFDFDKWKGFDFEVKDDGDKIIIYKDGKKIQEDKKGKHDETPEPGEPEWEEDEDGEAPEPGEEPADPRVRRSMRKRMMERDEKLYARGKQEMIDFLLDFGDAIDGLRDDQSIVLVAYLRDHEFFETRDISHFAVRAKMSDLRAYAAGSLTEQALIAKLAQDEY